MRPNGPKMLIFGQKCQFWAKFGCFLAKNPFFGGWSKTFGIVISGNQCYTFSSLKTLFFLGLKSWFLANNFLPYNPNFDQRRVCSPRKRWERFFDLSFPSYGCCCKKKTRSTCQKFFPLLTLWRHRLPITALRCWITMIVRLFIVKMATLFVQQTSLGQHFLVSVQQLAWARRLFDKYSDQGIFLICDRPMVKIVDLCIILIMVRWNDNMTWRQHFATGSQHPDDEVLLSEGRLN